MWRLKVSEGGKDPYIFSTNNFAGRQTWEFDPEAGSSEERSEVEEARKNFHKNRFKTKPCSDLLWQFQFLREKKFKQTIPQVKVEDGEEITYEIATAALMRAVRLLTALQASDGHWPAVNTGPSFYHTPFVMCLYITGYLNVILSPEHCREMLRYIYCHQAEEIPAKLVENIEDQDLSDIKRELKIIAPRRIGVNKLHRCENARVLFW